MCCTAAWFRHVIDTWKEPAALSVCKRHCQTENETCDVKACCKPAQLWPQQQHLNAWSSSWVTRKMLYWGWTGSVICDCCSRKENLTPQSVPQKILGISGCCHAVCGSCSSFTTVFIEWDSNADLLANTHLCDIWQVGVDSLQTFLWIGGCSVLLLIYVCFCACVWGHFQNVRVNMTFKWWKRVTADTVEETMKHKCQKKYTSLSWSVRSSEH